MASVVRPSAKRQCLDDEHITNSCAGAVCFMEEIKNAAMQLKVVVQTIVSESRDLLPYSLGFH